MIDISNINSFAILKLRIKSLDPITMFRISAGIILRKPSSSLFIAQSQRNLSVELRAKLDKVLSENKAVVFMKGNRDAPMVIVLYHFYKFKVRIQ